MNGPTDWHRYQAILRLAERAHVSPATRELIGRTILSTDNNLQIAALHAVIAWNDFARVPELGALLAAPERSTVIMSTLWKNPSPHYFAAKALRTIVLTDPPNREDILMYLRRNLQDGNPDIRREVVVGLGASDAAGDRAALLDRLGVDPSVWVREGAAIALGMRADPDSVPGLCCALRQDPAERVRMAAAETLSRIHTRAALYCLGTALGEGPPMSLRPLLGSAIERHLSTISAADYWNTAIGMAAPATALAVRAILTVYEFPETFDTDRVAETPTSQPAEPVPALPAVAPWAG